MKALLPYIVNEIEAVKARYEIHTFDSGAVMVDIWVGNQFYVIQIDGETIGLSLVTYETSFDTIPDQSFTDASDFKTAFENIFSF